MPIADAYKQAAELVMEDVLVEHNEIAADIREQGHDYADMTVEQLFKPKAVEAKEQVVKSVAAAAFETVSPDVIVADSESNLNSEQLKQVNSVAFKQWFGEINEEDSSTVGAEPQGNAGTVEATTRSNGGTVSETKLPWRFDARTRLPRVFYHGTRDDIEAFDTKHPNRKDKGWLGRGVYLIID